jgi:hypothetical protein
VPEAISSLRYDTRAVLRFRSAETRTRPGTYLPRGERCPSSSVVSGTPSAPLTRLHRAVASDVTGLNPQSPASQHRAKGQNQGSRIGPYGLRRRI